MGMFSPDEYGFVLRSELDRADKESRETRELLLSCYEHMVKCGITPLPELQAYYDKCQEAKKDKAYYRQEKRKPAPKN